MPNPQPGTTDAEPGTRNLEPATRVAQPRLSELAEALRKALERLDRHVWRLLEAVEAEGTGLLQIGDDAFARVQLAKEAALDGIARARGDVGNVLSELESALGCEAGALTVGSLAEFAPQVDWTYLAALGESICSKLEAAESKSSANVEMVQLTLD